MFLSSCCHIFEPRTLLSDSMPVRNIKSTGKRNPLLACCFKWPTIIVGNQSNMAVECNNNFIENKKVSGVLSRIAE